MGIYYAVANFTSKEYLESPDGHVKRFSLYDYNSNLIARLLMFKLFSSEWNNFHDIRLVDDLDSFPWWDDDKGKEWVDISHEAYIDMVDEHSTSLEEINQVIKVLHVNYPSGNQENLIKYKDKLIELRDKYFKDKNELD